MSAEVKHTPGPWHATCVDRVNGNRDLGDDGIRFWEVCPEGQGAYRGAVCTVHSAVHIGGITIKERDANAQLIASAPTMKSDIEEFMRRLGSRWFLEQGWFPASLQPEVEDEAA